MFLLYRFIISTTTLINDCATLRISTQYEILTQEWGDKELLTVKTGDKKAGNTNRCGVKIIYRFRKLHTQKKLDKRSRRMNYPDLLHYYT